MPRATTSRREKRRKAHRRGRWAEHYAALYLQLRGYRIIQRRFRTPLGEIDLIAKCTTKHGPVLVLVEVKSRPSLDQGIEAVTPAAQQRIARAGSIFLARHPAFYQAGLRYDVIAITGWRLRHIRDAWRDN